MKDIMLSSLCLMLTPGMRRKAIPVTVTDVNWLRDVATLLTNVRFVTNCMHTYQTLVTWTVLCLGLQLPSESCRKGSHPSLDSSWLAAAIASCHELFLAGLLLSMLTAAIN